MRVHYNVLIYLDQHGIIINNNIIWDEKKIFFKRIKRVRKLELNYCKAHAAVHCVIRNIRILFNDRMARDEHNDVKRAK